MSLESVKKVIRSLSRRVVEAGSHLKTRSYYEYQEQYHHFFRCLGFLGRNGIQGAFLEFGVADGSSILMLEDIADELHRRREKMSPRIIGFDSFEGLPEAGGIDRDHHLSESEPGTKFSKGGYGCSLERVQSKLDSRIGNTEHISLVKGWYDKTLTEELKKELQITKASLINIDCDFYESTKIALAWCRPMMQQGTIISFDDWFCYKGSPKHGEMLAFDEFLKENPDLTATQFSKYSWHGQSFIINCADSSES